MLEEMTDEAFLAWMAFEVIDSGNAPTDESDLGAIAQRQLEAMKRKR